MYGTVNFLIYIIILILTCFLLFFEDNHHSLLLPGTSPLTQIGIGVLLWMSLIVAIGTINILLFHQFALFQFTILPPKSIFNFLIFQFLAAVTEELLFRAYFTQLGMKLRWHWAVIASISAFIFAAVHWAFQRDLIQSVTAFFIGLVFSVVFQKNKRCSIYSLILAHFLYDIAISNVIL